jgi:hypothetical protein
MLFQTWMKVSPVQAEARSFLSDYCCIQPPTVVPLSVSIMKISFPAAATTKLKFNVLVPAVIVAVPVQLEFSVYVPEIDVVVLVPPTSKVPEPETCP